MVEVQVYGVNLDALSNQPVIILKQVDVQRFIPIRIGQFEATSILMELQGIKPTRPLTHDLLRAVIESMKVKVTRIVISDLRDGTFYAQIHLHLAKNGTELEIDSRPSDAIALAVRTNVPIFASENVVAKASVGFTNGEESEIEQFREFLRTVKPEDFKE